MNYWNGEWTPFKFSMEKKTFWFRPCSYFLEWSIKSFSEDKEEKREDISHFTVGVITFMIHIMETALLQRKSNVISELPHTSATSKHSFWGTNSTHEWWMENIYIYLILFHHILLWWQHTVQCKVHICYCQCHTFWPVIYNVIVCNCFSHLTISNMQQSLSILITLVHTFFFLEDFPCSYSQFIISLVILSL